MRPAAGNKGARRHAANKITVTPSVPVESRLAAARTVKQTRDLVWHDGRVIVTLVGSRMSLVQKTLWAIEFHGSDAPCLEQIAARVGVPRFHLSRAFEIATGRSVMRYARGRRLTEAARHLAAGAPGVLSVALDAGYGSHVAFSRAFRRQFGITPEAVRDQRHLDNLSLLEPIKMDDEQVTDLAPPRFESGRDMLIAGLSERYRFETIQGIPLQWQRFSRHLGHVPGQIGTTAYGVCWNGDGAGNFEYVTGVEVGHFDDLPADFARVRVPAQRYAVFTHTDNISTIRRTSEAIWNKALPDAGLTALDAPNFELYDDRFDPQSGDGEVEIWVPVMS